MIELDKVSEKILKQIIKHNNSLAPEDFQKIKETEKYTIKELADCLSLLKDFGFISLNSKNNILNITFKGKQYFLLKRKLIFRNFMLSFVVPLVIALITAYWTAKFTTTTETTILINNIQNI